MFELQEALLRSEKVESIDIHFARMMCKLAEVDSKEIFLLAAMVSSATREDHLCLDLNNLQNPDFWTDQFGLDKSMLSVPDFDVAYENLISSPIFGKPGDFKPLIVDPQNRLYLNRYWNYQEHLAAYIKNQTVKILPLQNSNKFRELLQTYFSDFGDGETDWQMVAACIAAFKKFCLITGGPGTGKTYTTAKILALLIEDKLPEKLKIGLAAPTGKAANRLLESIRQVKQSLGADSEIVSRIPDEAKTIHRLLGWIRHQSHFRYNEKKPLDLDVLVVDEASMVDLALMAKLVLALPEHCRLILLGDNNQLASVEAGAVLADIYDAGKNSSYSKKLIEQIGELTGFDLKLPPNISQGLNDCVVELKRSYRFEKQQGIGAVSRAVNAGDSERVFEVLKDEAFPDVVWHDLASESLGEAALAGFYQNINLENPEIAFATFDKTRILCAVREGSQGVNYINSQIEKIVRSKFKISATDDWFAGQPIIVTQNDYGLNLFNGDVGVILPDLQKDEELYAYFRTGDGSVKAFHPTRIQSSESAYAMTVHKSQGSEFENVILILPDKDSALLTRELIYTAITRASKKVEIWGIESVFHAAVKRKIKRVSGLRDALLSE